MGLEFQQVDDGKNLTQVKPQPAPTGTITGAAGRPVGADPFPVRMPDPPPGLQHDTSDLDSIRVHLSAPRPAQRQVILAIYLWSAEYHASGLGMVDWWASLDQHRKDFALAALRAILSGSEHDHAP